MRIYRSAKEQSGRRRIHTAGLSGAAGHEFPAISLLIPSCVRILQYPGGFENKNVFVGEELPAFFPAQGKHLYPAFSLSE